MKKIIGLDNWSLDKKTIKRNPLVEIKIYLAFMDIELLKDDSPVERKKKGYMDLSAKLQKLIKTKLFGSYHLLGLPKFPTGVKTQVPYSVLSKFDNLEYVSLISIDHISHAKKLKPKVLDKYFCVKITMVIQVEGMKKGRQTIEDRKVLIKAKSYEEAYKKVEKQKDSYEMTYMNDSGALVRWKLESIDHCYELDHGFDEAIKGEEAVEVYSTLRYRILKKEYVWDGKIDQG